MTTSPPPLPSHRPVTVFAATRLVLTAVALTGLLALGYGPGAAVTIVAAVAVVWSTGLIAMARRAPAATLHPAVAVVDVALLVAAEAAAPELYGAVRFLALFVIVTHADFQGDRGLAIAALAVVALISVPPVAGAPLPTGTLLFFEALFAVSALGAALVVGHLRATESMARLRAGELSRRQLEAENRLRRRVAESIHDGPVQELATLDMTLSAAQAAAARGDGDRASELLGQARELAGRNAKALRHELVGLGPPSFGERDLATAIENCADEWRGRYGIAVGLELDAVELPTEVCDALLGIAREAVANAGRHAEANRVRLTLERFDGEVRLAVSDDGRGFGPVNPLGPGEPGHIGLASMRDRAEALDGVLDIATGSAGTTVTARVPLAGAGGRLRRAAFERLSRARNERPA